MKSTIQYRVDSPRTRQEQEVLLRVGHVEDLDQGRHSDGRSTATKAFQPPSELRRTSVPISTPYGRLYQVLIANPPDSDALEAVLPLSSSLQ
jgi:hypothetical protein